MNIVILKGNVGKEPLTKQVGEQTVCEFSLATRGYKKEQTDWHNITAWGKLAEICSKYVEKGSAVVVQGRIQYRTYKGKDGLDKFVTDIVAENVEFMSKKSDAGTTHTAKSKESDDLLNIPF